MDLGVFSVGKIRRFWCWLADRTFWPVAKGLLLGFLMFVTLYLAYGIMNVIKWCWGLLP